MAAVAIPTAVPGKPSLPSAARVPGIYSATTLWQSVLALGVLPLHVFSPNTGLLARALVQGPIIWTPRFDSLFPLLLTSLSWLNFQQSFFEGSFIDAATGLEGYAYIFGVSLMILRYAVFRIGHPQVPGRPVLDRRFAMLVLLIVMTLIAAYRGVVAGERGWSSPFRAALTAGGFFYGVMLAQTYGPNVKLLSGFFVPAGLMFYGLSSLGYLNHKLIWTLAPFVSAAGTYVVITRPISWAAVVAAITLAVSGWRCILGPWSTGSQLLLWTCGAIAAIVATRQTLGLGRFIRRPAVIMLAVCMICVTIYVTMNKSSMQAEPVTRQESLSKFLWWKIVEDRGLIWSQTMQAFFARPLSEILFVPGGQSMSLQYLGKSHELKIGLHNAYLEAIYFLGLVPGGMLCCFIALFCWDCVQALKKHLPGDIEIMAFAVLISAIVGGFTGHYLIHQEGGTWFYLPAGIVSGYHLRYARKPGFAREACGRAIIGGTATVPGG